MRVHVVLHGAFPAPKERVVELMDGATADELAHALGVEPDLVLVFRGDAPLPGDEPLRDEDSVRVLRVVSGGARSGPATF